MQKIKKGFALQNLRWYHRSCLVGEAGAPYYDLAKEREGAPLSFPRLSCPNPSKLPSFSVAALNVWYNHWYNEQHGMRNIGQDYSDAVNSSRNFYHSQLNQAIEAAMQCNYDKAFEHLGRGLHVVQDIEGHRFITLWDHFVSGLIPNNYRDIWPEHETTDRAKLASKKLIESFIVRLGCNPFKSKDSILSGGNKDDAINKDCCCKK